MPTRIEQEVKEMHKEIEEIKEMLSIVPDAYDFNSDRIPDRYRCGMFPGGILPSPACGIEYGIKQPDESIKYVIELDTK